MPARDDERKTPRQKPVHLQSDQDEHPTVPDLVKEASKDSFPASDPPAFTGTSAKPEPTEDPDHSAARKRELAGDERKPTR